jgi:hypothetical protein
LISFGKYIIIQSVGVGDEMNLQINLIKKLVNDNSVKWSGHVLKRMLQRQITTDDVISCIMSGEIIESYPDDYPFPSCLIFGYTINNKILQEAKSVRKNSNTQNFFNATPIPLRFIDG